MNIGSSPLMCAVVATLLACTAQLRADLITVQTGLPDISIFGVSVNYNATTDTLTLSGFPFQYEVDGIGSHDYDITPGSLDLTAQIDSTGAASSGSFEVTGAIDDLIIPDSMLLAGTLSQFGFNSSGNHLQFVFDVTGGALASDFGNRVYFEVIPYGGFTGSWTESFNNSDQWGFSYGTIDIQRVVPAPGGAILALIGGMTVLGGRGSRWFRGWVAQ